MYRLLTFCILMIPVALSAQRNLDYHLYVHADLAQSTFSVKGTLSFLTEAYSADSVEIVISKCPDRPSIQLLTPSLHITRIDTVIKTGGDIAYHIKFSRKLATGSRLAFKYAYERGSARSFQYYIDSVFCMAGGYGSAWYPQVSSRAEDGGTKYTRGTGTISVTTTGHMTPVMAASTLKTTGAGQSHTFEFHYQQPDIFSLYIGNYTRQEYKSTIPFYTYSLSTAINGATLSEKAAGVLDFLTTQFGPLSLPNFSIIEFPGHVSEQTGIGGASILGGILMPTNALKQFNYALFGHELSHQWWGNKVISKGRKGNAMLSEGLAQYGSLQVVNHFDSAHAIHYRKKGYPGYIPDQSGFGYLKNVAAGNDEVLSDLTGSNDHIISDSKGFLVLELLSETTGKQKFNQALQTIASKYSQTGVSWENFLEELENAHGSSLQWFYSQWFERKGAPAWQTSWQQQQNEVVITLTQTDSIYRLPLEVLLTYANGETAIEKITVTDKVNQIKINAPYKVTDVKIDPYFKVIHWDDELTPAALDMSKRQKVQNLRMAQKDEEAEKLALSYLNAGITTDKYGLEFSLLYTLGRMKGMQQKEEEALAYYYRALQCVTRAPELLAYTYYRMAQIAANKKDKALFNWACLNAIKADAMNNEYDNMQSQIRELEVAGL